MSHGGKMVSIWMQHKNKQNYLIKLGHSHHIPSVVLWRLQRTEDKNPVNIEIHKRCQEKLYLSTFVILFLNLERPYGKARV